MRKTACPVVWEGGGAQSPSLDPIEGARPTICAERRKSGLNSGLGGCEHDASQQDPVLWGRSAVGAPDRSRLFCPLPHECDPGRRDLLRSTDQQGPDDTRGLTYLALSDFGAGLLLRVPPAGAGVDLVRVGPRGGGGGSGGSGSSGGFSGFGGGTSGGGGASSSWEG